MKCEHVGPGLARERLGRPGARGQEVGYAKFGCDVHDPRSHEAVDQWHEHRVKPAASAARCVFSHATHTSHWVTVEDESELTGAPAESK